MRSPIVSESGLGKQLNMVLAAHLRYGIYGTFFLLFLPSIAGFAYSLSTCLARKSRHSTDLRLTVGVLKKKVERYALKMAGEVSKPDVASSDPVAYPRSKVIQAFRSMMQDAGVDGAGINGKQLLSVTEIGTALSQLGYGQQEIECVFKQIDINGWYNCFHFSLAQHTLMAYVLAGDGFMTEEEFINACENYGICAIDDDDDVQGNKQVPESA